VTSIRENKLNLIPVTGGPSKPDIDVQVGDSVLRWSADGRFLFLRHNESAAAVRINRLDLSSGREEPWKEVKPADPVGVEIGQVVLTPDGNTYAYSFQRDISTLYLAHGLR
jgi:hypothetical protein